ncbi:unnamed protein product [Durusdinium trenchii]|uniref:Glucose-methanol-choline oxidoreductase N-terminal domain-containing protein n=1 Tax=Durusdinium trenchii TaxID=1381693 RepID=A0ABP0MBY0_9DINO
MAMAWLLLLLLVPAAGKTCPSGCKCSKGPGGGDCGMTVTCRNLIAGFPKGEQYPEGLDCLFIHSPKLRHLPLEQKQAGLQAIPPSVRRLDLSESRLRQLPGRSLPRRLRVLLEMLPKDVFEGLSKLRVLKLLDNPFTPPLSRRHPAFDKLLKDKVLQQLDLEEDSGDALEDQWEETATYLSDDFSMGPLPKERPANDGDETKGMGFLHNTQLRHCTGLTILEQLTFLGFDMHPAELQPWLSTLRHPGTAPQRALCFNPSLRVTDFEERFVGTKSSASVLLIEAGGEAHRCALTQTARNAFRCWQSEIDWGFRTTPQQHLLPRGRVLDLERGKTTGGSSAINYNLWVHGAPQDFDRWAEQYGCKGWSYKEVLPHFKSIEKVTGSYGDSRGKEGPVAVAELFPPLPEVEDFIKACEEHADAQRTLDYNAGQLSGVAPVQLCTNGSGGGRQDCFSVFVEPLLREFPTFQVASESFCRKVLLEQSNLQARGVELELRTGEILQIQCRKEVILSAGALLSPQLLMLSGIGDEHHLRKHGIECLRHLPAVGRNLSDHAIIPVLAQMTEGSKFLGNRVRNSCGTHGVYFWQSNIGKSREERLGRSMGSDLETIFNSRIELSSVSLQSSDPHVLPVVDPNYFSEKEDVDAMVEAFRRMMRIFAAPSFAKYLEKFHPSTPRADAGEAEISDYVRSSSRTTWHYSCTTRMGITEKDSVCDPEGRVHGVKNLRVADAGLMPEVVSGNTHAACLRQKMSLWLNLAYAHQSKPGIQPSKVRDDWRSKLGKPNSNHEFICNSSEFLLKRP